MVTYFTPDTLEGWLEKNNFQPADLDEAVHEAASVLASRVNNGGFQEQINFLKSAGWSEEDIKAQLRRQFIKQRSNGTQGITNA